MNSNLDIVSLADITKKPGQIQNFGAYSLCNFITFVDSGIPYIKVENYNEHGINWDTVQYIAPEIHDLLVKSKMQYGDVLLSMAGTIGVATIFDKHFEANSNQAIAKIRLSDSRIIPEFLSEFLNCQLGYLQSLRISNGGVQLNINLGEIGTILIPLPDLKTQRALVADMESARHARQEKLSQADELLSGIDEYLLSELGFKVSGKKIKSVFAVKLNKAKSGRLDVENFLDEIRNKSTLKGSYPNKRLVDIAQINMGQAPQGKDYNDEGKGLPLIAGAADLGEVYPNPQKWTTVFPKKSQPNDIILCIRATIGTLNWSDKEYCLGRGVAGIRPDKSVVDENYLSEALWMRQHYLLSRGTGSTFKQVTSEEIENCPIPIPPLDVQKKIAKEVEKRRVQARRLRAEAEREWQTGKEKFEKALLG